MKGRAVLTPEDIDGREFYVSLRGYDRDQVDGFRAEVAAQLRRSASRIAELETALAHQPALAQQPAPAALPPLDAPSDQAVVRAPGNGTAPAGTAGPETAGGRSRALEPLQPALAGALERGVEGLERACLDGIRNAAAECEVDVLLPRDTDVVALARLGGDQLRAAYRAGTRAGAAAVERPPPAERPLDPAVESGLRRDAAERLEAQLGGTLRVGLEAGERLADLGDRVRAVFAELRGATVEELAATHLVSAYELGALAAWKDVGVPARWWVLGREARCPEARCRQNSQAGAVPLDQSFPSGHAAPPVHPGCSCTAAPAPGVV